MRKLIFPTFRFLKWRVLVPAFWYLGLPHAWIADRFRLAPLLSNRSADARLNPADSKVRDTGHTMEGIYSAPGRASIYAASIVADTCRVLQRTQGIGAMQGYVQALIAAAPEHEPDIRWGEMLLLGDESPAEALVMAEQLYDQYPIERFERPLLQMLNQAGNIRRARALAERKAPRDASIERTLRLLKAREQLLDHGFSLPARTKHRQIQSSPKRVFYLLHNSLPYASGGYATRTHGLVRSLRAHGWDVECVTRLGYPSDINVSREWIPPVGRVDGVPYFRLKDRKGTYRRVDAEQYLRLNAEAVLKLARKRRPALIHGVSNHINGMAAVYAGRTLGVPSIYEVRGLWELTRMSRQPEFENSELYQMIVKLETQACLEADRVIAITEALKQLLIDRGVPASKILVVPNGVDVERFSVPTASGSDVRSFWNIPKKAMVLGYVGSMPQYEGLDDLIEAIANLQAHVRSAVHCLLVGDGDELVNLQQQVERLGLADQIHFVGRVPHSRVEEYYAAIDVLVFPRKPQPVTEAVSPIKPFEAMAMSKPILASNVAALAEIVSDGSTGLLFEKGSSVDLARRIERLAHDPDLRATLGEQGQRWVQANRDWRWLSRSISEAYQSLMMEQRHPDPLVQAS